ncbi:MAG: AbrB/MazE/SpoVT family DNA-binding domain-containing protein [bacterium]|nr:AbrB/MazE/SpoVT family DNA-binding domain-containing protein [bacterium]
MEQKIVQIGNSAGVVIPKSILSNAGLKVGSKVRVQKDPNGKTIILSQGNKAVISSLSPDFVEAVKKVNKKYGEALKNLANT